MDDVSRNILDRASRGEFHSDISDAVQAGDYDKVLLLLNKGENVNWSDAFGISLLMYAAGSGHEKIVILLLEHGADKDLKDMNGMTALDWAYKKNYEKIIKILTDFEIEKDMNLKSGEFILPEFIECPHCETELELEPEERRSGKLQCPECSQWIEKSELGILVSKKSNEPIIKKEMHPFLKKLYNIKFLKTMLISNFIFLLLITLFSNIIPENVALIITIFLASIIALYYLYVTSTSFKYMTGNNKYINSSKLLKNYRRLSWIAIANLCFLTMTIGLMPTPGENLSIIGKIFIILLITFVSPAVLYLFLFAVPDAIIDFYSRIRKTKKCELCGKMGQELETGVYYYGSVTNVDNEGKSKLCKKCQLSPLQKFMAISPLISIITIFLGISLFQDAEFNFIFLIFILYWSWSFLYIPIKFISIRFDSNNN